MVKKACTYSRKIYCISFVLLSTFCNPIVQTSLESWVFEVSESCMTPLGTPTCRSRSSPQPASIFSRYFECSRSVWSLCAEYVWDKVFVCIPYSHRSRFWNRWVKSFQDPASIGSVGPTTADGYTEALLESWPVQIGNVFGVHTLSSSIRLSLKSHNWQVLGMLSKFMQIPNASCLSPVHTRSQQPSKSTDLVHSTLELFGVIQAGSAALGSVANKPNHFATWHMFQHRRTRHCPYPMWLCQLLSNVLQYLWFGCWGSQNEGWLGRHATIPCLSLRAGVFSCWSSVYCVWTTHTCELSWIHTHTRWSLNLYSILRIMQMMLERCWREKVHSIPFSRPKGKKVSTGDMSDTYSNITTKCPHMCYCDTMWHWDLPSRSVSTGFFFCRLFLLAIFMSVIFTSSWLTMRWRCLWRWIQARKLARSFPLSYWRPCHPMSASYLRPKRLLLSQAGEHETAASSDSISFNSSLSDKYRSVHGPCSTSRAAPVPLPYLSLGV